MNVTAPTNIRCLAESNEIIKRSASPHKVAEADRQHSALERPFGPEVRVTALLYKRLRLLDECHRRLVSACRGFASSTDEPKFDMRPCRQRVIANAKFGLSRQEEVVASLQVTACQSELSL